MITKTSVESLRKQIEGLESCKCATGPIPFDTGDITEVLHYGAWCECWPYECDKYCDTWTVSVFKLKDGTFGRFSEYSDKEGHG